MDKSPYRSESAPEMGRQVIVIIVDRQDRSGGELNRGLFRQFQTEDTFQIVDCYVYMHNKADTFKSQYIISTLFQSQIKRASSDMLITYHEHFGEG
jgi:hypothetical protein